MTVSIQDDPVERMRSHVRAHVAEVAGKTDTSGLELVILIRMVENLLESLGAPSTGNVDLSGPRWSLLLRLMGEEHKGNENGVTPTYLSRCQNVSKNTMSSLLRGLEEQGLVQRSLDPVDHRLFRMQLTPAGRDLVKSSAVGYLDKLNQLVSNLSMEERETLSELLSKLFHSIRPQVSINGMPEEYPHYGG